MAPGGCQRGLQVPQHLGPTALEHEEKTFVENDVDITFRGGIVGTLCGDVPQRQIEVIPRPLELWLLTFDVQVIDEQRMQIVLLAKPIDLRVGGVYQDDGLESAGADMRKFVRDQGLSLFFLALFALALLGQSVAGHWRTNDELTQHGQASQSYLSFIFSSDFVVDVAENWQSEFLQFLLFILATVWFVQRGSPESKKPGDEGTESDEQQDAGAHAKRDTPRWARVGGWRQTTYENSLVAVMGAIFAISWLMQSLSGLVVMNQENAQHGDASMTWLQYVSSPEFWDRTLQNWQSEFLAVGTMVAFSVFLRQRGSAESKRVGAPHDASK